MAKWPVSMVGEQDKPPLLSEGWTRFRIVSVKLVSEEDSKSGTAYFQWEMKAEEGTIPMRTTLIKGKRWLLKQTLSACGIEAKEGDPDEKYSFGPEDVEGKFVMGKVVNKEQKPYTNRDGDEIQPDPKSEINSVKKAEHTAAAGKPDPVFANKDNDDNTIPF